MATFNVAFIKLERRLGVEMRRHHCHDRRLLTDDIDNDDYDAVAVISDRIVVIINDILDRCHVISSKNCDESGWLPSYHR